MPIVKRPKAVVPSKCSPTRLLSILFFLVASIIILCYLFTGKQVNDNAVETVPIKLDSNQVHDSNQVIDSAQIYASKQINHANDALPLGDAVKKNKENNNNSNSAKERKSKRKKEQKNKKSRSRELNVIKGSIYLLTYFIVFLLA